eukprot:1077755_1
MSLELLFPRQASELESWSSTHIRCVKCRRIKFDSADLNGCVSPTCHDPTHCYCIRCAIRIIEQSLSLLNEIPTCIISDCGKPFDLSQPTMFNALNERLPRQYSTPKSHSIAQYKHEAYLVNGYIRVHNHELTIIPTALTALIHNFYKLVCHSYRGCEMCHGVKRPPLIPCEPCQSSGFQRCSEQHCINGIMTIQSCIDCPMVSECYCRVMQSRRIDFHCSECNGSGIIYDTANYCGRCRGGGRSTSMCQSCDGKGQLVCRYCWGHGAVKPPDCEACLGNGGIIYPDFHKIIRQQKYCHQCGLYRPQNGIGYWSGCGHTFCDACGAKSVRNGLEADRIPICMVRDCKQELDEQEMVLYWKDDRVYGVSYVEKLKTLKYRKDRFLCCVCVPNIWHLNKESISFSHCGHLASSNCVSCYIWASINAKYNPLCPRCHQGIEIEDIKKICGTRAVHTVFKWRLKALFLLPQQIQNEKVLPVQYRYATTLYTTDMQSMGDKMVEFLCLTSIKVEDLMCIKIVTCRSKNAVFQLHFNDVQTAWKIGTEIEALISRNVSYTWRWCFPWFHNIASINRMDAGYTNNPMYHQ